MKLAGVVVLYQPSDEVIKNIHTYLPCLDKLFVVDNSSEDHSSIYKNKKIKYIFNGKNLGIAAALNIGAKEAIKEGFEWLLTMDQDSSFIENDVKKMIEFLERVRTDSFVQEIILTDYDKIGLISPLHMTIMNPNDESRGIDSPLNVMTSGNIISLKAYQEIGGFKDWFFIDCVDFEYCLNLRKHHYDIFRLNYVKLHHSLGNGVYKKILFKQMYSLNHSAIRRYYIVRNRHYLYDLYKDSFPEYCKLELSRTRVEAIKILLCEDKKLEKLKAMYKGYRDYKKGIKGEMK